jgi:hypothetical protein
MEPAEYDEWFASVFNKRVPAPRARFAASWPEDSKWGHRAHCALLEIEIDYVKELLAEIRAEHISGDIAEFGVFEGWWVNSLWEYSEALDLHRNIYGFDSFQGLSKPHPELDSDYWKEGMYACSPDKVSANVKAAERPRIKLIPGFFEDSLATREAQAIASFCYARIDCDIYEPALQCLRYLGPRLSSGAILVFDDWPHQLGIGEQRAFQDWLPVVPQLGFEFLFYGTIGHFYLRVHYR